SSGKTDFPDDFFHFTYSHSVFEHVADLRGVAAEIGRVTAPRGAGYHCYPARWCIVEGHLLMPFVHWLPKNCLRRVAIRICMLLGREPHWKELERMTMGEKVAAYYDYSVRKTYYRCYPEVRKLFQLGGVAVRCISLSHPKVLSHPMLRPVLRLAVGRATVALLLRTFKFVELLIERG
ncbi:methyltransferase domain-containing protein, partial [Candidatus Bipolaricaulota bacterium]|nr:methyltransferase domain-containing protein [Candidatus Bipolaricaulota bacterium]